MDFLKKIFHRRRERQLANRQIVKLSIAGIAPAPLTAEPDESELAAAALLESMGAQKHRNTRSSRNTQSNQKSATAKGSKEYYEQLAEKIKAAHAEERRAAMRYVAWCEQELRNHGTTESGNSEIRESVNPLTELEQGLFKWQDAVEREQGDLLKRWQHCLAEVTIRLMTAENEELRVKSEELKNTPIEENPPNH